MSSWLEFLQSRGARVVDGRVADFGDKARELAAARDATIVADLSDNALLAVSGDDATTFLHGQLTNDVEALAVDSAQWTGWCTPKGRLLASFLLVRRRSVISSSFPPKSRPPSRSACRCSCCARR
jgi:folate-binding Fe-S cluster repair protein YgfZ